MLTFDGGGGKKFHLEDTSELLDYFHLEGRNPLRGNTRQAGRDLCQFSFSIFSFSFGFQIHERLNHDNESSIDSHQELSPGTYSLKGSLRGQGNLGETSELLDNYHLEVRQTDTT